MAHWRGDGEKMLAEAVREPDPMKKLDKLEETLLLHFRELGYVLENLGPENFSPTGLEKLRKEDG